MPEVVKPGTLGQFGAIRETDELIDQIVYRLYGLTEEEISVVEASVKRG